MEIQYVHVKTRSQFGKQCIFDDEGPTIDENILPDRELMNDYIYRNPCHVGVQNSKQFAVHEVQTTSAMTKDSGMSHTEGGWPREMNIKDDEATARFRRRVEKDDIWPIKMKKLLEPMERCVLQNNAVNIYENFFDDMVTTELVLPLDVRTVNVYEDPQTVIRPITHLSWSPDHGKRLAVSYCSREFERDSVDRNVCSYIWEIENPNKPFMALTATCPSVTIEFNPRDPSMLISGLMTGQVCNWDIRQSDKPVQMSHLQFSHRNPTNLVLWINSKTNTEFFSASTGGAIKWWDLRKLREPTETLVMDLENPSRADVVRAIGVSSLQYEPTMGTKFMAGMENGIVVSGTRKGKNAQEKLALRFACHDGPVVAIDRNPFSTKNFLTVGGWDARIWAEDTREGNLISNKCSKTALTGGCWSTSRYSVFYLIDESGIMKIYDVLVGMKSPIKTLRLCEAGLKAIAPHEEGTLVAVGSDMGNVYLVESSEGLTTNTRNDKLLMTTYLDRCSRYEKAVDNRLKEIRLVQRISIEQGEEPILPTKGKSKVMGKDPRVKDVNANDKRPDERVAKGKIPEDRDKKGKGKMKKIKDNETSSGDPELDDATIRYYDVVDKETERYAEIAALEESAEEGADYSSTMNETRRRNHEDSKFDKETSGAAARRLFMPDKRDETKRRSTGRRSRALRFTRADSRIEEIVIVRKPKGDRANESQDEKRTFAEMNEQHDELDVITEENDDATTLTSDGTKKFGDSTKRGKRDARTRGKVKKRVGSGKNVVMKKPCTDYVCEPDVCCVDEIAQKLRAKHGKIPSPWDESAEDSETEKMIEETLTNLPKAASPEELGNLLDPLDESTRMLSQKLLLSKKDARPTLFDEPVKIAQSETKKWRDSMTHGKSTKLQRRRETTAVGDSSFREIFENPEYTKVHRRDSEFMDQEESSSGRITIVEDVDDSVDDEIARERENYTRKDKTDGVTKIATDCEPVAVKFGEKEIKMIIGIPDAPRPPSRPRFDESMKKITKTKEDYPRISAAAMPKLEMKDDLLSKRKFTRD